MQVMQSDFIEHQDRSNIQTPTKRMKKSEFIQPNTADSLVLTDQKNSSLNEIDPQQLFDKFHEIIKISELQCNDDQEEQPKSTCYRTLNYQTEIAQKKNKKLEFSTSPESMNKKNKVQNGKCLSGELKMKGKQLFQIVKVQSPKKTKPLQQSDFIFTEATLTKTPTKKPRQNICCHMTAKKLSPYRDLIRKE